MFFTYNIINALTFKQQPSVSLVALTQTCRKRSFSPCLVNLKLENFWFSGPSYFFTSVSVKKKKGFTEYLFSIILTLCSVYGMFILEVTTSWELKFYSGPNNSIINNKSRSIWFGWPHPIHQPLISCPFRKSHQNRTDKRQYKNKVVYRKLLQASLPHINMSNS